MRPRSELRAATCPACHHAVATPFYDGRSRPLATLAWPSSAAQARGMKLLPHDFVRCCDCGHVFNASFDYDVIPYAGHPNRMFNACPIWAEHLADVRDQVLAALPEAPIVVEIGCGEGDLLQALAEARPSGRYLGFDPHAGASRPGPVEMRRELFDAPVHVPEIRPHMVVVRHVLEHLVDPLGLLQLVNAAARASDVEVMLFAEVPCIDRVFETGRTADFFYEHCSHFTSESFARMLELAGSRTELVDHGYGDEVVFGMAMLGGCARQSEHMREANGFRQRAEQAERTVTAQLDELAESGRRVAIWGGTGKSAAFIASYGVDPDRFATVVDSDPAKVDTFVPGTGQRILHRDHLLEQPADVIVITTQWRAREILAEVERAGIAFENILLEHDGRLVDYFADEHPYRERGRAASACAA